MLIIKVWKQVGQVISGDDVPVEGGEQPPRGKREAISLLFTRLDIQFKRFCSKNLSASIETRGSARMIVKFNCRR
jgi:hypothetical protein